LQKAAIAAFASLIFSPPGYQHFCWPPIAPGSLAHASIVLETARARETIVYPLATAPETVTTAQHGAVDPDNQGGTQNNPTQSAPTQSVPTLGSRPVESPPVTAPATPARQSDFVIPDSDRRILTPSELKTLSKEELRIARNEIFARKGRYFSSPDLAARFSRFSWYSPNTWNPNLNSIEEANIALIDQFEKR
jgi:hypothetical protein